MTEPSDTGRSWAALHQSEDDDCLLCQTLYSTAWVVWSNIDTGEIEATEGEGENEDDDEDEDDEDDDDEDDEEGDGTPIDLSDGPNGSIVITGRTDDFMGFSPIPFATVPDRTALDEWLHRELRGFPPAPPEG